MLGIEGRLTGRTPKIPQPSQSGHDRGIPTRRPVRTGRLHRCLVED